MPLSENIFISSLFLKDIYTLCAILDRWFPQQCFGDAILCLASTVAVGPNCHSFVSDLTFLSTAFKVFSLSLVFHCNVPRNEFVFICPAWKSLWFLRLSILSFSVQDSSFLKYCLPSITVLSPPRTLIRSLFIICFLFTFYIF